MQDIETVIAENIGLVKAQLKRLSLYSDADAESIGYEALYNAACSFDETQGCKFSTYATCCIYNALGGHIRNLKRKRQLDVISYNCIINEDGQELVDLLQGDNSVETDLLRTELCSKVDEVYDRVFSALTNAKHQAIIQLWHDSEYEMTSKEVANRVGVSQPYVSQVISTFKFNMKKKLEVYINA